MLRAFVYSFVSGLAFVGYAEAASVVADATAWGSAPDPEFEAEDSSAVGAGSTVTFSSFTQPGAFVSDVSSTGDFEFRGRMLEDVDNDIMGIVFGYADGANSIRIGWGGGDQTDSDITSRPGGLYLIEETADVASLLYHDEPNNWTTGVSYDFFLSVTGSTVDFEVRDGATIVGAFTETVTRNTDGKFGVYVRGQPSVFSNLAYDLDPERLPPVPLPAGLPLLLAGLGAMGLMRRGESAPQRRATRTLRRRSRPNAPRPPSSRGRAAGRGTAGTRPVSRSYKRLENIAG